MMNLSNGLAALSMLSGNNSYSDLLAAAPNVESRAVRVAKAKFTLPQTTPPWKEAANKSPESVRIAEIKRLTSIIDTRVSSPNAGSDDIQTAFTTYKALDKLKLLATAAARTTVSTTERASLQASFAKGLADLQSYLGQAPTDKVQLSFASTTRHAATVSVAASTPTIYTGTGLLASRYDPLPGLTGNETFQITLNKPNAADTITVDLSQTEQPPTLDSVSNALNAAIADIPLRNPDGSVMLDEAGNAKPRWLVRFLPDKTSGQWGFSVSAPNGTEQVSIDQVGAPDAITVATGQTAPDHAAVTQILRFDDVTGAMTRSVEGSIASVDSTATAQARLTAVTPAKGVTVTPVTVYAATTTEAIATDAKGFNYIVGTSGGDLGSNKSNGSSDLFLTKLDSEGGVVWQRSLGASGTAKGAAIAVSANGEVTVAGTVSGSFAGSNRDGDMMVARYNAQGDETFATVVAALGSDTARAIAVGADGSIYLGGKASGGDAFVARLDNTGRIQDRRTIDAGGSESITALAIGADGNLLALTNESGEAKLRNISALGLGTDLASLSLGQADARALAVSSDGTIAVVGATSTALNGTQTNSMGADRDGFVSRIDASLGAANTTYLATAGDDQVDSVTFMSGALYVGGRTTGDLNGTRNGSVDGFISRIDAATGAIGKTTQFGQSTTRTEAVRIAASVGSDTVLGALGLHRGALNAPSSVTLVAQTSLRAGDEFSLSINGGAAKKVVILANDTLKTLGDRIRGLTGSKAKIVTATVSGAMTLGIDAVAGSSISLVAGPPGKDALSKLGLDPKRLSAAVIVTGDGPKVNPGGSFGLALTAGLNIGTAKDAAVTLAAIKSAISTTQTAYRSLYWDEGKAALTDGANNTNYALTSVQAAQLANYQAALARLTPTTDTTSSQYYTGF